MLDKSAFYCALCQNRFVEGRSTHSNNRPGKLVFHSLARSQAHLCTYLWLAKELLHGVSKRFGVTRRNEQTCLSFLDSVCNAANCRTNHGTSAGHRFERSQAKRLVPWRRYDDIARTVVVTQLIRLPFADKAHMVCNVEFCRQPLQLSDLRGGNSVRLHSFPANNHQRNRRRVGSTSITLQQQSQRTNNVTNIFAWQHPADVNNQLTLLLDSDAAPGFGLQHRSEYPGVDC